MSFQEVLKEQFPFLKDKVYVDWTGAALPPISLINAHHEFLSQNLLGNPHSHHAPSARAMEEIMATRRRILEYFNASPDEYEVIFTSGATAAIRLLEHFKFEGGELLLSADNHNSINGLRETAKQRGAVHRYAPITDNLRIDPEALERMLSYPRSSGNRLFAYPAKSNYTGTIHDLSWVEIAQAKGWHVLLDAAAYLSNSRLNLSRVKPDFVPVSFYKLFGFPTGVGCLLIRRRAYNVMFKRHFSGGSILLVAVMKDFVAPEALGYARYEDGSVNFGQIMAIKAGLEFMERMGDIKFHAVNLATQLYDGLYDLAVGKRSVLIHSARGNDTVTFSVRCGDKIVNAWEFEHFANSKGVYVRTGCFCNPGVNERVFGYTVDTYERLYNDAISPEAITIEKLREYSGDTAIGAIRASFGYANQESDVSRFIEVTRAFLDSLG